MEEQLRLGGPLPGSVTCCDLRGGVSVLDPGVRRVVCMGVCAVCVGEGAAATRWPSARERILLRPGGFSVLAPSVRQRMPCVCH